MTSDTRDSSSGTASGAFSGCWTFSRAIDALVASARQAGRPSFLWLAGCVYMFLAPGWHQGWSLSTALMENVVAARLTPSADLTGNFPAIGMSGPGQLLNIPSEAGSVLALSGQGLLVLLLPVLLVGFRLQAGLARLSPPASWRAALAAGSGGRSPRLRQAWRAGRGITLSVVGLNFLTWFMLLVCGAFMLGPVVFLDQLAQDLPGNQNLSVLFAPAAAFLLAYGFLLSVLFQLALQSLSHNARGSGSAFQHAWRLARHNPKATLIAVLVDVLMQLVGVAMTWIVGLFLAITCVGIPLMPVASVALMGFLGTTRCAFWARAYRALGGITAADGIPGMSPAAAGKQASAEW